MLRDYRIYIYLLRESAVLGLGNLAAASLAVPEQPPSEEGYAGKARRYAQRALKLNGEDAKLWPRGGPGASSMRNETYTYR